MKTIFGAQVVVGQFAFFCHSRAWLPREESKNFGRELINRAGKILADEKSGAAQRGATPAVILSRVEGFTRSDSAASWP